MSTPVNSRPASPVQPVDTRLEALQSVQKEVLSTLVDKLNELVLPLINDGQEILSEAQGNEVKALLALVRSMDSKNEACARVASLFPPVAPPLPTLQQLNGAMKSKPEEVKQEVEANRKEQEKPKRAPSPQSEEQSQAQNIALAAQNRAAIMRKMREEKAAALEAEKNKKPAPPEKKPKPANLTPPSSSPETTPPSSPEQTKAKPTPAPRPKTAPVPAPRPSKLNATTDEIRA